MPGRYCAVFSCSNRSTVTKAKGEIIVYHNFPKGNDSVSAITRKEWIRCCKRADKWNPNTCQICSEHFTANDYERDLQNELLGLPTRKKLKKTAVPTVNLPLASYHPENNQRRQRLAKRQRQREVQDILNNSSQPRHSNSEICRDSPQIELIMCDDLPLAVVENHPEDIKKHQRLTGRHRQREIRDILNNSSQSHPTTTQISKDSQQIELIMCDDSSLTVIENHPEDIRAHQRLARRQRRREVKDILNNSSQSQPTISEIFRDLPQIELIMCDDLPFAGVENHPEDIQICQRLASRQWQREDSDILNSSSQHQSTISEDSPQIELIMCDEKLSMESNYQELLQKYNKLEEQYRLLKSSSRRKFKLLSDQVHYYENKCSKLKSRGKPNLILIKRKCNRKLEGQSFKERELQLLHLIDNEDNVCYKISDKHLKIDNQKR